MPRVCIGIHVHAEPERLHKTLACLHANTSVPLTLLLLPDGPDVAVQAALATLRDIPQSTTTEPRGGAACFNRLVTESDADVVVLLESGALVGPGWLDYLIAALALDSHNGLAGPSTNNAWNEQGVYPRSSDTLAEVARTAREAALRFGTQVRTLEPLYSLADFCYVVRREVIDAIGAADEGYALGPCWEMDYNIRAARAGWRGVWACAAYVYRPPFTARRKLEEARRFEANKYRYQDKFCGARLRGEKSDYRSHCRGDACPNFAPRELIISKQALTPPVPHAVFDASSAFDSADATLRPNGVGSSLSCHETHGNQGIEPLVTCIMPTYNRRSFIPQAIRCFLRQDYPNLELLIVDDGTDSISDCVSDDVRIRYVRLDRKLTIGAKRNLACAQARGEVIVHWDDDDWYPPWRVRTQVRALLDHSAELCGSSRVLYYDGATDRAWEYRYAAPGAAWVAGNTLAYRKSFWEHNKFPDIQVGEDSRFVWSSASKAIADLADPTLCIATVHTGNTSRKETAGTYWHPQPSAHIQALLGDELYFYRTAQVSPHSASCPLVSCIMPTYNRRSFVPLALHYFCYQDYPRKELVIIDDGDDAIGDLLQNLPNVRYVRLPHRASIGAKRNLACQHAQGEIIAHWDDDDWYAPDRLRYQVAPILVGQADMTGLENAFVLELPSGTFWTMQPQLHQRMFVGNVHGGTLVYRKKLLEEGLRYPEVNLAEDAWLLQLAMRSGKRLLRLSNPGVFVYVRHGRNAWRECVPGRFLNPAGWQRIAPPPTFPASVLAASQAAADLFMRSSDSTSRIGVKV